MSNPVLAIFGSFDFITHSQQIHSKHTTTRSLNQSDVQANEATALLITIALFKILKMASDFLELVTTDINQVANI